MEDTQSNSRFNLVLGDNGVGKSKYLKEVTIREYPKFSHKPTYNLALAAMGKYFPGVDIGYRSSRAAIFRVVSRIIANTGKAVVWDNFASDVHYRRLDNHWSSMIILLEEYDCKMYFTTQSRDVVGSFVRAFQSDAFKHLQPYVRSLTLYRTVTGKIKTRIRNYDALYKAVDEGYNVMGGE